MSSVPIPIRLPPCDPTTWACPGPLPDADFQRLRRRLVLDHFKWDPQVGDVSTVAAFPLILPADVVHGLFHLAELLAQETSAAETELLERPDLTYRLGLPRAVRRALHGPGEPTPAATRVIRFDFHTTTEGWRISEANSDVPGGYAESAHLPWLMAEHFPGYRPTGDPLAALVEAVPATGTVALIAAPGYLEDQQVIACLAAALAVRGWRTIRGHPGQLVWTDGLAAMRSPGGPIPVDAIVRFFQGEWLAHLPPAARWPHFFRGGRTPVCNPGTGLLTESKRFPLVWDELKTPVPTWRTLLPETREPRWRMDPGWLLKAAFANNGDEVHDRARRPRDWRRAMWAARLRPGDWALQRRFEPLPVRTPDGPMTACLGVYTVNGRTAGIYGRLTPGAVIDFESRDVAVLSQV